MLGPGNGKVDTAPGQLRVPSCLGQSAARGIPKVQARDTDLADALSELVRATGLVRRIGVNLNQAVARLNATGQRSGDLLPYARESLRRADMLTRAAEDVPGSGSGRPVIEKISASYAGPPRIWPAATVARSSW